MKLVGPSAFLLAMTFLTSPVPLAAQIRSAGRPADRITTVVDDRLRVVRRGNVHPLARVEFDQGPADADLRMDRMVLVLEQSPAQQTSLEALLAAQQDPASPQYHQWLSPDDFGAAFGVSDRDLDQITGWLTGRGFRVEPVDGARRTVVFSGSAAQVEAAFHTSIHVFSVNGEKHYANASDPELPQALASVVRGVVSLHNFALTPSHHDIKPLPEYTNGSAHYLAPADFATIYDVTGLYNNSIDGAGQSVAVVGRTNFNMADVTSFRSRFGLPVKNPTVVLNGSDPGIVSSGELGEALLDVEWAGAVAKNANVQFVLSASTNTSDGVTLSSQYIVSHNLAPVMSLSFGSCELSMGTSGNQFWNALWQQAAAQGITVLVAAGDSGAAGCDNPSASAATSARSVSGLCSSPYSTCVGGTQFADTSNPTAYWSATSNATTGASALSYIPEAVWNQSASSSGGSGLWAGGGGASSIYAKPAWQTGPGVPADGHRDVPDLSLNASTHDGYLVTMSGQLYIFGGTSASTPSMAGLMTLLAQKTGARQGNANPVFYALASRQAAGGAQVFHDTTAGNNTVTGVTGYSAGVGYDAASGLGSVDAALMVNHWTDGTIPVPVYQLLVPVAASVTQGASKQVSAQVTVSGGFSGAVALSATGTPAGMTATFAPASFSAPGSGSSTLTLAASSTAVPGTYNLTIKASSGSTVQTATLAVTVVSNCSYSLSATSASPGAAGGAGTVNVTTGPGCAWTTASNVNWITITSGTAGSGNGAVQYSVAKNTGVARADTLTIAGATFTLNQAAGVICTYSLSATNASTAMAGGAGTVNVASGTGCAWTAVSNTNWITIASGATGLGNGVVQYSVAKNTGTSTRSATMTIAGVTFTVTQAAPLACTYAVQPGPLTTVAGGYSATIAVTAPSGCAWTAASNASWITIKNGATGTGNGSATIFATTKPTGPSRSGTFVVAGYSFTFTEN